MRRPTCALMVDDSAAIVAVALPYVAEKITLGWFLVARDDDVLSEPIPEPIPAPEPSQSNPQREHRYRVDADFWREDGA